MATKSKPMSIISMDMPGDYQALDDLRTLSRASTIKKDKKRFSAAMKLAQEQIATLENLDPEVEKGEDEKKD